MARRLFTSESVTEGHPGKGFDGSSCGVSVSIGAQSPDIAQGVNDAFEYRAGEDADELDRQGAGDQGLMFGCSLDLLRPIYASTATYGHFGRTEPDFAGERADRTDQLRAAAGC